MYRIALKMLFGDRAKYAMLISGLTFCSLLITQQSSVFCGLMLWTTAIIRNIGAPIWVADQKMEQANETVPMREIEVDRVRSVPGVEWAVPLYVGQLQARLEDGSFQNMQIIGLDTATLVGRPARITAGNLDDLRLPDAVVVDQVAIEKFRAKGITLRVGTTFEINDRTARVVAICFAERSFFGLPYVYTTYDRAIEYAPRQRKLLSFVLVQPQPNVPAAEVCRRINAIGGLRAVQVEALFWETIRWYIKNTGIPISFGTVVLLGIVVGVAIAGQTFYLFIVENLRHLAALKAMGANNRLLTGMVLLQSTTVGFIGYGLGVGLAAIFGNAVLQGGQPPFFMPWQVLAVSFAVILFICALSSLIGLRKIVKLEPAVVFR